jgi:hypothetical protein
MIGFIDILFTQLGSTGNYSAIASPTLYCWTLPMHQGSQSSLVVSWQRIYAQPNSFLAIILQLPNPKIFLNSIPLLPVGWRLETQLTLLSWTLLYNYLARTTQKSQPRYCWEGVFRAPLQNKESCSIVVRVFVAAMCLPSRCLAMLVYSIRLSGVTSKYAKAYS